MSNGDNNLYEFGNFRLNGKTRTLHRRGEVVSLSPKAFELLTLLIDHRGEVISKQEIFDNVWRDTFVEAGVLTQNIYTLRNALGLDENGRQFIENVPKRGYRFSGQLKTIDAEGPDLAIEDDDDLSSDILDDRSSIAGLETSSIPNDLANSSSDANIPRPQSLFRSLLFIGFGVLLIVAAGIGIYKFSSGGSVDNQGSRIAPIEQIRFQRLTDTGDVIYPTISPNGELLAFVRLEEERASVWVQQTATGNAVQTLPSSQKGYASLVFSSDGQHLFFREQTDPGTIYQTSPFGGTPKKIADNVWSDFSLSPDDKQVAFIRRDTTRDARLVVLANVDGTGEREVSARQSPLTYNAVAPAWSPDGTRFIVFTGSLQQARPLLLSIDVSTGAETELETPNWLGATRALWMPDGKRVIVAARATGEATSQLWMLSYPEGEVRRLTNDLEAYFWISLSADGRMLVTRQQKLVSHLWLLKNGDIKKAEQITFGERNTDGFRGLAWAPDGGLVFTRLEDRTTNLYLHDRHSVDPVQLTTSVGPDNAWPTVSADGRYIVFTSHRSGSRQIWRMDIDGRNQTQLTFGDEAKESSFSATLSHNGESIFFLRAGPGPSAIWKVPIDGGPAAQVSRLTNAAAEDFLSVSPDGKWLAYRHVAARPEFDGEPRTIQIGVLPTDGNAEPMLFDLPMRRRTIQWSADSAAFYYDAGTFNTSSLWRQPLTGAQPEKVLDFPDRLFNFVWSADEKNLAVSRGKLLGDAILITDLP